VLSPAQTPSGNRLLAALPQAEYSRLAPHLTPVDLPRGKILCDRGERLTHAFFPTEGIVSVLVDDLADGTPMEIASIGKEGMISVSIVLEGLDAPVALRRSVVQMAGHAYRIPAAILLAEFERAGQLQNWLLRFTQALITQVAQIAVCNQCHELEAQVCRWLLQRIDRQPNVEIPVTQQEVADMLGVRREGVTGAASRLQEANLIRYARGHLVVLDPAGLAKRGCECRDVIQKEYARLLGV
jgi:CRP-like cAMP-binding protein